MKSITIDVTPEGKIQIEGKNFVGKECDRKMEEFEKALGSVTDRKNLPEYHRAVTTTQQVGG